MGCGGSKNAAAVVSPQVVSENEPVERRNSKRIVGDEVDALQAENRKDEHEIISAEAPLNDNKTQYIKEKDIGALDKDVSGKDKGEVDDILTEEQNALEDLVLQQLQQNDKSLHTTQDNGKNISKADEKKPDTETLTTTDKDSSSIDEKEVNDSAGVDDVLTKEQNDFEELDATKTSELEVGHHEKYKKLVPNDDFFKEADERALNAPDNLKEMDDLLEYLVEPFLRDPEVLRLRAIWRWVTHNISYDTDGYFSGKFSSSEADVVLSSGVAVCQGYGNLMKSFADLAGIKMEVVSGHAKGYSYKHGESGRHQNHAWNAVYLDGQWWLLDATWSAGNVNGQEYTRSYNEHYFLTDPQEFINDHFPEDKTWQLLTPPVSVEVYETWANFSKIFYNLKLSIKSDEPGQFHTINTEDGILKLEYISRAEKPVKMTANLHTDDGTEQNNCTFIETFDSILQVRVNVPKPGNYKLAVFGTSDMEATRYDSLVEYSIICGSVTQQATVPFPMVYSSWSHGFHLISPVEGILNFGQKYRFEVHIPKDDVILELVVGDDWVSFQPPSSKDDNWIAEVEIPSCEEVSVLKKEGDDAGFQTLLQYQVSK